MRTKLQLTIIASAIAMAIAACTTDVSGVSCTSDDECAAALVCMAGQCIDNADAGGDVNSGDTGGDTAEDSGADADTTPDAEPDTSLDADTDPDVPPDADADPDVDVSTDADADPGECGDGTLDDGEECDDGAANNDILRDACRTDCTLPSCGDGVTDSREECDYAAASTPGPYGCTEQCFVSIADPCLTCTGDGDCAGVRNQCTPRSGRAFCTTGCGPGGSCPDGYVCQDTGDGPTQCIPTTVTCGVSCEDADGDGYGVGAGCLGPDCNDSNSSVNPGSAEACFDMVDNDCDFATDCEDAECSDVPCSDIEDCFNGFDDDGNGLTDCADPACEGIDECFEFDCFNGFDDDRDGLFDCEDPDCEGDPDCEPVEFEICDNGFDDDFDDFVDCDDFDCFDTPECATMSPEICDNEEDDDGDGAIDCEDFDCIDSEECIVVIECFDESYEFNDSFDAATEIAVGQTLYSAICEGDTDVFRVHSGDAGGVISPDSRIQANLLYDHEFSTGDLVLEIWQGNSRLATSNREDGTESVSVNGSLIGGVDRETLYLRVLASGGFGEASYRLSIPTTKACVDDVFEENDTFELAAEVHPGEYEGLRVCPSDRDTYQFPYLLPGEALRIAVDADAVLRVAIVGGDGDVLFEQEGREVVARFEASEEFDSAYLVIEGTRAVIEIPVDYDLDVSFGD